MFGRSSKFNSNRGGSYFGTSSFGKKRKSNWIFINRRKHKHHHENKAGAEDDGSVIMTRDSPAVESISGVSYDISDERRPSQIVFSTPSKSKDEDMTDAIELANKDPKANGEHNGVNHKYKDTKYHDSKSDNDGCVKCVYFAQQCCECVIV